MGDFNIDLLKTESCDYNNRFLEILSTSLYIPLVLRPTRITQHTATLIDNIFTNDIDIIDFSINGAIFSDILDHIFIVHLRNLKRHKRTKPVDEFTCNRIINYSNMKTFTKKIKSMSWENFFLGMTSLNPIMSFLRCFQQATKKSFHGQKRRLKIIFIKAKLKLKNYKLHC